MINKKMNKKDKKDSFLRFKPADKAPAKGTSGVNIPKNEPGLKKRYIVEPINIDNEP